MRQQPRTHTPRPYCGGIGCKTLKISKQPDGSYKCDVCGWTSMTPPIKNARVYNKSNSRRIRDTMKRVLNASKYYKSNPGSTRRDLIKFIPETSYIINKYWESIKGE